MKRLFLLLASAAMICSLSGVSNSLNAQPQPPKRDQGHNKPKSQHKPEPHHKPAPHHNPGPHHNPAPHHKPAPHHSPAPHHKGHGPHVVRVANNLKAVEDPRTGLYGYLNNFGVWVIAPTYRYAKSFDREIGLAVVRISNGSWGAIDALGQTAILFNFDSSLDVESAIRNTLRPIAL